MTMSRPLSGWYPHDAEKPSHVAVCRPSRARLLPIRLSMLSGMFRCLHRPSLIVAAEVGDDQAGSDRVYGDAAFAEKVRYPIPRCTNMNQTTAGTIAIMTTAQSRSAWKNIRSSLGGALAMRSAPLVDIGLTSTTEELIAIAVTTPMGVNRESRAIGVTRGLITLNVPVVDAKADTIATT